MADARWRQCRPWKRWSHRPRLLHDNRTKTRHDAHDDVCVTGPCRSARLLARRPDPEVPRYWSLEATTLPRGERFETLTDAARIDDTNIARMLNFRPDLAAEIERCDEEESALACRSAHERPGAIAATSQPSCFASPRSAKAASDRDDIYARLSSGRIGSRRSEARARSAPEDPAALRFRGLVGGTEIAWLERHNLWILHCHLLAIAVLQADWVRLRKSLPDASPAAALKVQALKDFPEQLSYFQKFNSSHKPGKRGPNGRAPARPLPTERLIEWAEWMAKRRFEDFAFLFGARRRGGRICPEI